MSGFPFFYDPMDYWSYMNQKAVAKDAPVHKENQKKCKSCYLLIKNDHCFCAYTREFVKPKTIACKHYKKRK